MNKFKFGVALLLLAFLLTGCSVTKPKEKVEDFLNNYINQDEEVISELDNYLNKQDLTKEQKKRYKKIIQNEYATLNYKIKHETINEDVANYEVEITVIDLYSASKEAENDLLDNPLDFYVDGSYSSKKFIDYKLDIMENTKDRVTYTISIELEKKEDGWHIKDLDEDTLEKIHGIYNYQWGIT